MIKKALFSILILFTYAPAFAQDYTAEIAEAEQLGKLLYEYDSAGWGATDALMSDNLAKSEFLKAPVGYVTLDNGNGTFSTAFITEGDEGLRVKVDVLTRGKNALDLKVHPQGRKLGGGESLYVAAKGAALRESFEPCEDFIPMNSVIIPGDDGTLYVYLMSATQNPNLIVFGRHYKFRVDRNDVTDTIQFTNSCLGVPKQDNGVGAMTTHLRTPYPQEHHVFASLAHGLPIFVGTSHNNRVWEVKDGKIREIKN